MRGGKCELGGAFGAGGTTVGAFAILQENVLFIRYVFISHTFTSCSYTHLCLTVNGAMWAAQRTALEWVRVSVYSCRWKFMCLYEKIKIRMM